MIYYQDGLITLHHADCRDVLPLIERDAVALLLTDPPYGMDYKPLRGADGSKRWTEGVVGLMRWIVEKWTQPGDLVVDPYMGSGPVAEACRDLGRRYIGIEREERYCEAAVGRLSQDVLPLEAS